MKSSFFFLKNLFSSSLGATLLVIVFLVLWMLTGLFTCSSQKEKLHTLPSKSLFHVDVENSVAQKKELYLSLTGTTKPNRSVTLSAKTPGTLDKILVQKGIFVKQGILLALMEEETRRIQLKETQSLKSQNTLDLHVQNELSRQGFSSKLAVKKSKAQLMQALVKEESILKDLKDTKIKAPFDGLIDKNFVESGSHIEIGDPLFTFLELNPILVNVSVPENVIDKIAINAPAVITFLSRKESMGNVIFKSSEGHSKTHAFEVGISLPNPSYLIKAGQTVGVKIFLEDVIVHVIPPQILTLREDGTLALRHISEENIVLESPVNVIFSDGENLWVTGLPSSIQFIKTGQEFVKQGQEVEVSSGSPPSLLKNSQKLEPSP